MNSGSWRMREHFAAAAASELREGKLQLILTPGWALN